MNRYTFHNSGTVTSFRPTRITSLDGKAITSLDLHMELVRIAGRPDVFVCDNRGRLVEDTRLALAA